MEGLADVTEAHFVMEMLHAHVMPANDQWDDVEVYADVEAPSPEVPAARPGWEDARQ